MTVFCKLLQKPSATLGWPDKPVEGFDKFVILKDRNPGSTDACFGIIGCLEVYAREVHRVSKELAVFIRLALPENRFFHFLISSLTCSGGDSAFLRFNFVVTIIPFLSGGAVTRQSQNLL